MIVKDEASVIARCLASVRPLIDHWIIVDTGSTDNTPDVIHEALHDIPGELHQRPWVDFAHNRTEALDLARSHGDYTLIIDADDVLELPLEFRLPFLKADSYAIEIWNKERHYWRPQVIRNSLPWRYEGVLHEFLSLGVDKNNKRIFAEDRSQGRLRGVKIRMSEQGARRRASAAERFSRDAAVLEYALTTEADPFLRARYKFYLGQCYLDAGDKEKALAAYQERAALGFWDQEVFISLYRSANLKADLGFDEEDVVLSYLKAHDVRKDRAEALHGAARYCRIKQRYQQGFDLAKRALKIKPPNESLFLEDWIYRYALLDEFAVNAYWIGRYNECLEACTRLLNEGRLPDHLRERVSKNAELARNKLASQVDASPAVRKAGGTSHTTENEPQLSHLKVILICGPWGSGTSVVAGLLDRLGAFGLRPYFETADPNTPDSYESIPFREIILRYANQENLSLIPCTPGALQSDLRTLQTRIEQQQFGHYNLHSPKPMFLKYPLSALLIPQICEVFDAKLIYVMRPLEDIERTRLRRNWLPYFGAEGAAVIYSHMSAALMHRPYPTINIDYKDMMASPMVHARNIARFVGLDPSPAELQYAVDIVRKPDAVSPNALSEVDAFTKVLRAAREKEHLTRPDDEVISAYLEASAACPTRAEALHGAARFCRNKGMHERGYQYAAQGVAITYPNGAPAVEDWIYDYGLLDELAVNAYWTGRYKECVDACDRLLTEGKLPTEKRDRVLKNKQFAIDKLQEASARAIATDNQYEQFETPRSQETVVSQLAPPHAAAKENSPSLSQPVRAHPERQAVKRDMSNTLHVLGVAHTIPNEDYLVCAFTAKVLLFPEVIQPFGWNVIEYSNEGSVSKAREHVVILTTDQLRALSRRKSREEPLDADVNNADLKREFQRILLEKIRSRARPGDIVCHVWGPNMEVYDLLRDCQHIELSVGYTASPGLPFRVYESSAWMHWHYGKAGQENGNHYKWVIPSPFDAEKWAFYEKPDDYALFLGRVTGRKGINTLVEIARRMPELPIHAHGPGDPSHWAKDSPPNLLFKGPIFGNERADVVGRARCMLMPTNFIEPFGFSGIEAQLCGVPLIAVSYGAFQETIVEGVSGYRCHTLADWVEAIRMSGSLNRRQIATLARAKYSKEVVGKQYDWVLKQLADLSGRGWYADKSRKFSSDAVLSQVDTPRNPRIWLYMPYFGAFPNYFQLYLDSLGKNADCLSVFLMTDNDLSGYRVPDNLIPIQLTLGALREKVARFINDEFGMKIQPDALLKQPYKLNDFRIVYPELFRDVSEQYGVTEDDFIGWGDCDLIYGRFSDFLDMKEDYHTIGGFHGHLTALRNIDLFRKLFKAVDGLPGLLVDEKSHIVDEIAFRKPLQDLLERNGYRMFYINRYFCDIVPECFFGRFRQDHAQRKKNFFDAYHPDKEIDHVHYGPDGKLTVVYEDGESRQSIYCHLQKRAMSMDFDHNESGYYIREHAFRLAR